MALHEVANFCRICSYVSEITRKRLMISTLHNEFDQRSSKIQVNSIVFLGYYKLRLDNMVSPYLHINFPALGVYANRSCYLLQFHWPCVHAQCPDKATRSFDYAMALKPEEREQYHAKRTQYGL